MALRVVIICTGLVLKKVLIRQNLFSQSYGLLKSTTRILLRTKEVHMGLETLCGLTHVHTALNSGLKAVDTTGNYSK